MKQGSFRAVRRAIFLLVFLSLTVFAAFGDEKLVDFRSIVLESFNGGTTHQWEYGGRSYSYEYDWALDASKFATKVNNESFPRANYVEAWPQQLWGTNRNNTNHIKSFGIWGRFDRRGYNWIDVYPVVPGSATESDPPQPFEIPLPGRVSTIDAWVWGSNHNFYMEAYIRDFNGVIHSLYMGDLAYVGWRNLKVQIPNHIRQSKRLLPHYAGLTFVKFRIWTMPRERVDNFYVYFNQVKVLTDTFESMFDGDDLANPEVVQEIWAWN